MPLESTQSIPEATTEESDAQVSENCAAASSVVKQRTDDRAERKKRKRDKHMQDQREARKEAPEYMNLRPLTPEELSKRREWQIKYTDEQLLTILEDHASGKTIAEACRCRGIEPNGAIYERLSGSLLAGVYAQARQAYAHNRVSSIYDAVQNEPDVQRARLYADVAKWEVSKVLPRIYGDQVADVGKERVVFNIQMGNPSQTVTVEQDKPLIDKDR